MAREVDSVTGFLKKESVFFLSKGRAKSYWGPTVGREAFNLLGTEMLAPVRPNSSPSYGFVALYDDGDGAGFELFKFVKARVRGKPKLIYVQVDPHVSGDKGCILNGGLNYYEPQNDGETFGLSHDSGWYGAGGYFTKYISFMGGSPGPSIFQSLGIKRRPRSGVIDIYTKTQDTFNVTKSTIFVHQGEEIVKIEGKTITSKVPVYIHGTSSDWELNGYVSSANLPQHPKNNSHDRPRNNWIKNWGGSESRIAGGDTSTRTDFSDIYFDGL
tara:strand:+ start:1648 stop:2460 length:813 start_codon:yes stop_codon:yes gene_type:complete